MGDRIQSDMRYSHIARSIIIQYIKKSMKPIDSGEVLGGHQITTEGRIIRWFQDILEGNIVFINIDPKDEAYTYLKLHYRYGWPLSRISDEYLVPEATLRRKVHKFLGELVENMPLDLGHEILRINDRHETEELMGELAPRWEKAPI